jgi:hypothetical protein
MFKLCAKVLCSAVLLTAVACVTTDEFDSEGNFIGSTTRLGEDGSVIATIDADGNVIPGPLVEAGKSVTSTLPQPLGGLATFALGLLPWLASKRSRKQLLVKPVQKIKAGDVGGAVTSLLAGVGLGHSEPDPHLAFMALREKGIAEGWLEPDTGMLYEDIGKSNT